MSILQGVSQLSVVYKHCGRDLRWPRYWGGGGVLMHSVEGSVLNFDEVCAMNHNSLPSIPSRKPIMAGYAGPSFPQC